jgi:hypothetical protein
VEKFPFFVLLALLATASSAMAQSNPNWTLGFVPSPSQWNTQWSSKVDTSAGTLTGGTLAGGTLSGTFAGSPTFSGNPTFSGTPVLPSASITGALGYTPANRAGDTLSGTFAGSPTFSGNPVASGLTFTPSSGSVSQTLAQAFGLRVVTAAGAITLATTDHMVEVNKTVGAATTVNMPACNANAGFQAVIIDGKGDAGTNNITLTPSAGTINGSTTFVMNINRQGEAIYYDGSQCVVFP